MKTLGVDHITINCPDPEAAFNFYEQLLSLEKLETVDMGDHTLYYYQLPGIRLELIAYREPQKQWKTGNTDVGIYRHMAFLVDDLDTFYQRCRQMNVKINMIPSFISQIGKTVMLIQDPSGVEIELIQS
jgi:lactoylglutathione lyase